MASLTTRWLLLGLVVVAAGCAGQPDATECATGITCPAETICAAVQPVCLTNPCGDGVQQSTEVCDDGNIIDGDGCSRDCASREVCGDGVLNNSAGELCDDGNTTGGDGCAMDCRSVEVCGNGIRDVNEACDDGNTVPGDGCSGNCKSTEVCGNNIVDLNEKCDDGGTAGGCNDDCQGGTGCGDGAIDRDGSGNALEECDDGNSDNTDDCLKIAVGASFECRLARCGDGLVNSMGTLALREQCDPSENFGETDDCNLDCTIQECGDNKLNLAAGEQCDPGMLLVGDDRDCTAACKVNVCGDGLANTVGPDNIEDCDDMNTDQTDGCSNQCTQPDCGNGVLENMEACDDFNTADGDGCSSACVFETCGDGVVNNGEDCDPGSNIETAKVGPVKGCNSDCTFSDCGDGRVNQVDGEECDDQNANDSGDQCRNTCKKNVCGDSSKSDTEACDDGDQDNLDGCTTSCTMPSCGNGIRDMGEECDDGNTSDTDGCLTTLCVYATCGDAKVQTGVEECDPGTANMGLDKNCLPNCKLNTCGDGFRDLETTRVEACDDGNTDDETECPYGVATCNTCNDDCTAVVPLTGNVCGDGPGAIAPEICDDGNDITDTECAYGAPNGTCQVCNATCTMLVNETGPYCGDGDVTNGEVCDDGNATCGTCNAACTVAVTAAAATGIIVAPAGSNGIDGKLLTINDGVGHTVIFEFDTDSTFDNMTGRVRIGFANNASATTVREEIQQQIFMSSLDIGTADIGASGLLLTHDFLGSFGNQTITTTATDLYVSGMSGGRARDCADGTRCESNADCRSGDCNNGLCD